MKILFIHGLASSGAYKMASTLRILLKGSEVTAPDVPIEPSDALALLEGICSREKPDLIVGLSLGGFWAQKLRGYRKMLVNPDLHPSRLLRTKVGVMEYLSPRQDGAVSFRIDETICQGYETLEKDEFKGLDDEEDIPEHEPFPGDMADLMAYAVPYGALIDPEESMDNRPGNQ